MLRTKSIGYIFLILVLVGAFLFFRNQPKVDESTKPGYVTEHPIDKLTSEQVVVPYVKQHGQLPTYYIKKSNARKNGWNAAAGNLCEVLPGKAIGGDVFTNREGSLPKAKNRKWFEADLNYNCGRRNADRLLFSNDGLIYVTYNHYKTFQRK